MPRLTRIYTRTGDDGSTALGGGQRLPKDALRIAAFGTVDELSSLLGAALALGLADRVENALLRIQNELFHLGSDLCILEEDKERLAVPRVEARHVDALESEIDQLNAELEPLANFVLPGGSPGAAMLHVARAVCRRGERLVVALSRQEAVGSNVLPYLNRLSDLLFVMARWECRQRGVAETIWDSRA
jgi:cob(I)alamin adenosyltransferase